MEDVVFKSAKNDPAEHKFYPTTADTLRLLNDAGSNVHIAFGNGALHIDAGTVTTYKVEFNDGIPFLSKTPVDMRIDELGGMLNRSTITDVQSAYPLLRVANNLQVRQFADKFVQATMFPDLYIPTVKIEPNNGLNETARAMIASSSRVILKWNKGLNGDNIVACEGNIESVNTALNELTGKDYDEGSSILLQPYLVNEPIESIKALTSKGQQLLEELHNVIELRVFCAVNSTMRGKNGLYAIGRNIDLFKDIKTKTDNWIGLNQETIPLDLFTTSAQVAQNLMTATESKGLSIAIDYIYSGGRFYMMELNVRDPQYPTSDEDPETSRNISQRIANIFSKEA